MAAKCVLIVASLKNKTVAIFFVDIPWGRSDKTSNSLAVSEDIVDAALIAAFMPLALKLSGEASESVIAAINSSIGALLTTKALAPAFIAARR